MGAWRRSPSNLVDVGMVPISSSYTVTGVKPAVRRFTITTTWVRSADLVRRREQNLLLVRMRGRDRATAPRTDHTADISQRSSRYRLTSIHCVRMLFIVGL